MLKINWDNVGLGKRTDEEIAKTLGVSSDTVYRHRRKLGISGQSKTRYEVDWTNINLGTKPDSEFAKDIGCTTSLIWKKRNDLGVRPFIGIFLTQEGDYCRSIYEAMYDAYLHSEDIKHQHEIAVSGLPYIADFLINGVYVEIFGMKRYPAYEKRLSKKLNDYKTHKINYREVTIREIEKLYKECPLRIRCKEQRTCSVCKSEVLHFYCGLCRNCYQKTTSKRGNKCKLCGQTIKNRDARQFCSVKCRHASMLKTFWPDDGWFEQKIIDMCSGQEMATELGVSTCRLFSYLYERRKKTKNSNLFLRK